MRIPQTGADVLGEHVTLEVESIDRVYLKGYIPQVQHERGGAGFFRYHRGATFASSALRAPLTHSFVAGLEAFAQAEAIPLIRFRKGERKDDVAQAYLARFAQAEGVLCIGKPQEKGPGFRTEKRRHPETAPSYPWRVRSPALVNQYSIYALDRDFGPFFLKFSWYFPYHAKLCLKGHESAQRHLAPPGIAYEAVDTGFLRCAEPLTRQAICAALSAEQIAGLVRQWWARLPPPFSAADCAAGSRSALSILQAEFALTQVLARPLRGRILFEEIMREHLDLGRPDPVPLIFPRRVTKRTPGRLRTRVITQAVTPSLPLAYKSSHSTQSHKEGRTLRTETPSNHPRAFARGNRLVNLPAWRQVGFAANRRLLDVHSRRHDGLIGKAVLQRVKRPVAGAGQRTSALRCAAPCVHALLSLLVRVALLAQGFRNRTLRRHWAALLGEEPETLPPGRMTYHLRRLRLHGLSVRSEGSHCYRVTPAGFRLAFFSTRTYARLLRPGLALLLPHTLAGDSPLRRPFDKLDLTLEQGVDRVHFAP